MAVQIYSQSFWIGRRRYESSTDVRNRALEEVNKFLIDNDSVDVVNIIEAWKDENNVLSLVVYYKGYI